MIHDQCNSLHCSYWLLNKILGVLICIIFTYKQIAAIKRSGKFENAVTQYGYNIRYKYYRVNFKYKRHGIKLFIQNMLWRKYLPKRKNLRFKIAL